MVHRKTADGGKMQGGNQGFSLIELMVIVAVIGVLAGASLIAYQDYATRSRLAEALAAVPLAKLAVLEVLASGNAQNNASGYASSYSAPPSSRNVQTIEIDPSTGVVAVTTSTAAGAGTLTFTPNAPVGVSLPDGTSAFAVPSQTVSWRCAAAGASSNGFSGVTPGSLPSRLAPPECR